MSEELKSCPFCGGEAIIKTEYTSHFVIGCECSKCFAKTGKYAPDIKNQMLWKELTNANNLLSRHRTGEQADEG